MSLNRVVTIGDRQVGGINPCFIVAEIGINHNGDLETAKKLIDVATRYGVDAVKFQKRTIDAVFAPEELARPRESPFGTTYGDVKRGLEFGYDEFGEIDEYCKIREMKWYASCWDEASVDFIEQFNPPCHKIASASLTDDALLSYMASKGRPIILSTGMSTIDEIDHAVELLQGSDLVLLHSTSTYPAADHELNLNVIPFLEQRFDCPVGYSGHETGVIPSVVSVCLGAAMVERHITLDRAMWGTDQAASLEPRGVELLVKYVESVTAAMGDGIKVVYESELPKRARLRRRG
ncbi:MAG: N-acetylneuraminate synthase family protein [Acidimicrobiia bacterium]